MLNIFYGRESIEKEKFIFEQIHGRALIIVPDQFTLEAEQLAFRHLGVKGLMDIEVISMSRLGTRLLSELGGVKQTFIDKYGRHMILAGAIRREKDHLQVFRGLEGKNSFIELVNNFISELKQYNCGVDELKQMADEAEEGSYTRRKLEDLALLYSRYEDAIRGKYTDSEDYIDLYLQKIQKSKLIEGNHVWIYGFDSFAPKALQVIGQLIGSAADVNVVLTWDQNCRDEELFDLTGIVMYNLEQAAKAVGAETRRQQIIMERETQGNNGVNNLKNPAISHLEKELYTLPSRKCQTQNGIHLVAAAGLYNEAESAAAYVLHLVRDQGLRFRDIRVVCNDQDSRGPIIERIFQEYGIKIFRDNKRDILSSPIVQYIISLLDVVIGNYRSEDVFRALKSGFGDVGAEEVADLENYAIKYRIRRTMWRRPFEKGESEYGEDGIARLEEIRKQALKPFLWLEPLLQAATTADFINGFYQFLYEKVKLPEKILQFIERQEALQRPDLADETGQIWGKVIGILDQMIEIIGTEIFDKQDFLDLFKVGLSQVEIGVLPPTKDGLLMGTMQRTRMPETKALVVIGANEGLLPQESPAPGLFSSEEKDLFQEKGRTLCKVDSVVRMEERLAIYRNLSKPQQFLWMSYSLSDSEGKESKPSSVFLKIKELFPNLEIERDILNQDNGLPLIQQGISGLRHLTEQIQETVSGTSLHEEWGEMLHWYREKAPHLLEPIKEGLGFTNFQEKLGEQAARYLFLKKPEEAISFSPSRLERFSRCPFSHFVSYGLRPEERRIFQIAPREIGDIYHACLMELASALTKEDLDVTHPLSPWMTVTRQQCSQMVRETAERQMMQYREGLFHLGNEERYRSERIYDICDKVCWAVVEQVRAGQIEKNGFEVAFRRDGQIHPLEIQVGQETVYVEGKIDRVDYLPDQRVKIIDYKTGDETFRVEEAKAGYRLQLMLYLAAACEESRKPAGVFYFKISDPMIDGTGKELDSETLDHEIQKSFKLNGVMVDEPRVIENIAGDFSGFSEIVPLRAGKEKVTGTGKDNLLSEEEFAQLQEDVQEKVTEICRELLEGKIDIHPMKTKTRSACTFCTYKGICRFDTVFEGCSYHMI